MNIKILLISVSSFFALLICELYLKYFNHRYRYASEISYKPSEELIYSRLPNETQFFHSPRTGKPHRSVYNNLGLRQSRNFHLGKESETFNIALFGDSLLENIRMPTQFSLSEPIDYVLNNSGLPFNVLNFGVEGYGIDQSYTQYRSFKKIVKPKLVFFFFIRRHIRILYETQLYQEDEEGQLVHVGSKRIPFYISALSRLNLTYLFLESFSKLKSIMRNQSGTVSTPQNLELLEMENFKQEVWSRMKSDKPKEILKKLKDEGVEGIGSQWKMFLKFLLQWKSEVERDGGRFFLVLIPRENISAMEPLFPKELDVLNLLSQIRTDFVDFEAEQVSYPNDLHWDERGNALAAFYISRFIVSQLNLKLSDDQIISSLNKYFSAFSGIEFLPGPWRLSQDISESEIDKIRKKYINLETNK